jgi:hypothetical protein
VDNTVADSLRKLYTELKGMGSSARELEAKSLMRDAPDVQARAHYTPRHPSPAQERSGEAVQPRPGEKFQPPPKPAFEGFLEPPVSEDDAQRLEGVPVEEPLLLDEDTRPNPVAKQPPAPPLDIPQSDEPEFLVDLAPTPASAPAPPEPTPIPPPAPVETPIVSAPAEETRATQPPPSTMPAEETLSAEKPPAAPSRTPLPPAPEPTPTQVLGAPETPLAESEEPAPQASPVEPAPERKPWEEPTLSSTRPISDPSLSETATISVFEVFGVPRPSDSEPLHAVELPAPAAPALPEPTPVERVGLRLALRRKHTPVRRL